MTQAQFDSGYWYATELKEFAKTIGIPSASRLRNDELEKAIKVFLKAGKIESPTKRSLSTSGAKERRTRAEPQSSRSGLHERQGNQGFP